MIFFMIIAKRTHVCESFLFCFSCFFLGNLSHPRFLGSQTGNAVSWCCYIWQLSLWRSYCFSSNAKHCQFVCSARFLEHKLIPRWQCIWFNCWGWTMRLSSVNLDEIVVMWTECCLMVLGWAFNRNIWQTFQWCLPKC